jgi:hypothetical protein
VRGAGAAAAALLALAGCFGPGFADVATPCGPVVPAEGEGLRVHLRLGAGLEDPPRLEGTCVGLQRAGGDPLLAAATVDAEGNATLPRLADGRWVTWSYPDGSGRHCYFNGFAQVPAGATAVTVEVGKVCA